MSIPSELRDSLHEVFELIQQSMRDPDLRLDFDDAIQIGAVRGGRFGKKPRPYVLTYYPAGDRERGRWFLTFDRAEIEDIGDGRLAELMLYCCSSPECRCKFREADDYCFDCDYLDDPNYGNFVFPEAETRLAQRGVVGLCANSTRDEVIAILGPPDASGGGTRHPPLGYIWPWIKYRRLDCQLRFEFNKTGVRIRMVTVLEKDWEPGK